jgi:Domain of unknown function (DUF4410)
MGGRWRVGNSIRWKPEIVGIVLLLGGCAHTGSSPTVSVATPIGEVQPTRLIVAVDDDVASGGNESRRQVEAGIEQRLIKGLGEPHAEIAPSSVQDPVRTPNPHTLLIACHVTTFMAGSEALRLAVGFGARRVELAVTTQVVDLRGSGRNELATFQTHSTTGHMPGPGLGLLSAVGSGQVLGMALGAGVLAGTRQTLVNQGTQVSDTIVAQLHAYFLSQGWVVLAPPSPSVLRPASPLSPPRPLQDAQLASVAR